MVSNQDKSESEQLPSERVPDYLLQALSEYLLHLKRASDVVYQSPGLNILLRGLNDTGLCSVKWDRSFLLNLETDEDDDPNTEEPD